MRICLDALLRDIGFALRLWFKQPLFSLTVLGLLAIGIAGTTAIFSIFNGLFLRPLPFAESGRLVELDETSRQWDLRYAGVSVPDFMQWRKENSTFDGMAFFTRASYNLATGETAQRVDGVQVTRGMLDVLRMRPLLGRDFRPDEDLPGGARVVLLNYALWQRMFQSDPNIVGRVLKLDEQPYTVIGVLPAAAVFPDRADLWTPLAADPGRPSGYYLNGLGRLKSGVSMEQAQADVVRIHKAMIAAGRKVNRITSPILTPLRDRYLGNFKTVSGVLFAAVCAVLLTACVNIAALMMARGSRRSREMAIRAAIGAPRGRIAAQLLSENLLLAVVGGGLGVLLGTAGLHAMVSRMPPEMPQWISFSLDMRFAVFCIAITGAAALLFGLAPALQASRSDVRASLSNVEGRATGTRGSRTALGALVVSETALALMLSIGAGLLLQAFHRVLQVDPGFRPANVLRFGVSLPEAAYQRPEQKIAYYDNLLQKVRALPGVTAAGATSAPPLGGHWGGQYEAEGGRSAAASRENPVVLRIAITPGYLDAIGMRLLGGRRFDPQDGRANSPLVVMINASLAKLYWGQGSPVGKRIRYAGGREWYQIIGLLADVKHDGLDRAAPPAVFLPYQEALWRADANDMRSLRLMSIVLRTSMPPQTLAGPAREVVRQLDPDVAVYGIQTMAEQLDQSLWSRRAYSWLFGAFAAIALVLSAAGIYGTVSYAVSRRTREIGIRVALGARPAQVLRQVLEGGMSLVLTGVAAGLLCALWAASFLRTLLFGVASRDPLIYALVVLGVTAVGLLANLVPARRAASVDPIRALHFE